MQNREHVTGMGHSSLIYSRDRGMDESRIGAIHNIGNDLKDLDTLGRSALELASSSR